MNAYSISRWLLLSMLMLASVLLPVLSHAEQQTEDVFASVIVNPSFKIVVDKDYLDFGLVRPGESVALERETYYNTLRFVSNKGRRYYIKIHLLGGIVGPQGANIPISSVKWKVYQASGTGALVKQWQQFSNNPAIVYTSSSEDEIGNENSIRFQYRIDLPAKAPGGHYSLKVAYLLSEEK